MTEENKFGVAVKAMIEKDGKILLIHKSENEDINPKTIDIPGGRVEFGEDIEKALIREIKEETNLDVEIRKPTNIWSFLHKENFQLVGITFLCKYVSGEINLSGEHEHFIWVDKNEVNPEKFPSWLVKEFKKLD